jgi:hypothetical protein
MLKRPLLKILFFLNRLISLVTVIMADGLESELVSFQKDPGWIGRKVKGDVLGILNR